jgi:hypothetical protein
MGVQREAHGGYERRIGFGVLPQGVEYSRLSIAVLSSSGFLKAGGKREKENRDEWIIAGSNLRYVRGGIQTEN